MRIHLLAVGQRMPAWVSEAYEEYAKRLPRECSLILREIAPGKRGRNADILKIKEEEGERILAALSRDTHVVALDVSGKLWSTEELAQDISQWLQQGRDIAVLIGGPDGLSAEVLQHANERRSLSRMTFPHPLVRVIMAEQIYRAWTVLNHHPYHL
ncbi:MAG: 23S rRNA (pseudouridine(1915)-N(3))-methyltransferase RlmH [Methylococcaceae bacterium]